MGKVNGEFPKQGEPSAAAIYGKMFAEFCHSSQYTEFSRTRPYLSRHSFLNVY
jgi:hypothetical protein